MITLGLSHQVAVAQAVTTLPVDIDGEGFDFMVTLGNYHGLRAQIILQQPEHILSCLGTGRNVQMLRRNTVY